MVNIQTLKNLGFTTVLIPSGTKAGKLYSLFPEDGSADFTVSRNGSGTRINKLGQIEVRPANVPRIDYDPITGKSKGILIEPAATNSSLFSQDLNTPSYLNTSVGILQVGPEEYDLGLLKLQKVVEDTSLGLHTLDQRVGVWTDFTILTLSVFFKAISPNRGLTIQAFNGIAATTSFNPVTKTFNTTSANALVPYFNEYGDGVFKVSFPINTLGSTAGSRIRIGLNNLSEGLTYTGDGASSCFLGGYQREPNSVSTSYIPTTTVAVTRPADGINKAGEQSLIGQTEGSIYIDSDLFNEARSRWLGSLLGGSSDFIQFWINPTNFVNISMRVNFVASGTLTSTVPIIQGRNKIVFIYKLGFMEIYLNGVKFSRTITLDYTTTIFSAINVGAYTPTSDGSHLNGHIRSFALSKTAISDADAISITKL